MMIILLLFRVCVASAVILHEREEETIANGIISGLSFFIFCAAGYLTGTYFPVIRSLRCIVLVWNPFYYQPNYLHNLKQVYIFNIIIFNVIIILLFLLSLNFCFLIVYFV